MTQRMCATHHQSAPHANPLVVDSVPPPHGSPKWTVLQSISDQLTPILTQHHNNLAKLNALYEHNLEAIDRAMNFFRLYDRTWTNSRAEFKLRLLAETVNLDDKKFRGGTLIDFGAAPGNFMRSYISPDNLVVPFTIQSAMSTNLDKDGHIYKTFIKNQYEFQHAPTNAPLYIGPNQLPRRGVLAPECYPSYFANYDGNVFCSSCVAPVVNFFIENAHSVPPVKLIVSDIGAPITYDELTHQPHDDMDYFYLPHLLLNVATTIEKQVATYYNQAPIMIICELQRFSCQLCNDPNVYSKLLTLLMRCEQTGRHLIITKPYGSRLSNQEMYAIMIPFKTFKSTRWSGPRKQITPILHPYNMTPLIYTLQQMDATIMKIIEDATNPQASNLGGLTYDQLVQQPISSLVYGGYNIHGGGSGSGSGDAPLNTSALYMTPFGPY